MKLSLMKIFIQVYQTQNITRAAERLHMTQPAVTRAIREIENYYGVTLFERMNRGLSVTESGRQLYAQALHIVESFDIMEKGLRNWDEFGILRVGASITLGSFLMPGLVAEFGRLHPHLKLKVRISNGESLQQLLTDNQLDIAFIEGSVVDPQLKFEAFSKDRLVLIMHPGHPLVNAETLCLRDLMGDSFLLREPGSAGRTFFNNVFAVHGLSVEPAWESMSTQAIIKAVSAGIGISFLPEKLVRSAIDAGYVATHEIADEPFERDNHIVWHQNKFLTPSAQAMIELCHKMSEEVYGEP